MKPYSGKSKSVRTMLNEKVYTDHFFDRKREMELFKMHARFADI